MHQHIVFTKSDSFPANSRSSMELLNNWVCKVWMRVTDINAEQGVPAKRNSCSVNHALDKLKYSNTELNTSELNPKFVPICYYYLFTITESYATQQPQKSSSNALTPQSFTFEMTDKYIHSFCSPHYEVTYWVLLCRICIYRESVSEKVISETPQVNYSIQITRFFII